MTLLNEDGILLLKYLSNYSQVFCYCDPPYPETFQGDYISAIWTFKQYQQIAQIMKKAKCKIMVNVQKTEEVMIIFKDFNIITTYKAKYQSSNIGRKKKPNKKEKQKKKKVKEHLIITNYKL